MKKINKLFLTIFLILVCLTGCMPNYDYKSDLLWDTNGYNYAIIKLPNGEIIEGKIISWRDFDNCEQLEIKMNGITYYTNSYNCILIYK